MKIYGKRLRLTPQEEDIIRQFRGKTLDNINDNTALDLHLKERGIEKKDVVSVKHWQSANGDYRFSVVTKENLGVNETTIIKNVSKFIQEYSPEYPKIARKREGSHLLVVNPADIHIGKYANSDETGEEYNSNIAFVRVIEGIEGLIQKSNGFAIGKILFCIGNDVLHIDNVYNTTTKGTRQDVDGKWWEHLDIAMSLYVKCIERLREIAPVDVVHCMSNHDYQSGYHLAKNLESWFRNAEDVSFDVGVAHRKYYKYGKSLIGFEHGDAAKMDKLPLLMAQEKSQDWADTKFRYWYLHHLHHKIKYKWQDAKDYIGVTVEYLRSPSGSDSWHHRKGYCGIHKAVEGFIHEKENGQVARITHYF
tara:strand:+ start:2497 stop:3585 length:1089 start_codon:yes stop_codon:yes gene_type:complete